MLDNGNDIASSAAATTQKALLDDADREPVAAAASRARPDQLAAVSFQIKATAAGDFVFDADRLCRIKDHSETFAIRRAPIVIEHFQTPVGLQGAVSHQPRQ